ncbi:LacI family DNA-binding transcriptional regulator [Cryptosporangium sp. NPDC048952]|uniref:LacI family DNA-binding transcriptional regulator n=1 Tax=Cryptosporangium sp. NPDC048952 TaxID=3363961 RepID=UPI00371E563A
MGNRRPTLADVAAEAGVSVALVSIVMRGAPGASAATRERVLEVADRIGYRPDSRARLLRSGRSRLLGVVFGVQHAFHGDLLTGLYDAAARHDYELTLSAVTPLRDERTAIAGLLQDRCEALLVIGPQSPTSALAAIAAQMPVVALGRDVRHHAVDVVRNADCQGLHQAVEHLVSLGHRTIVHLDGGRTPGTAERRRGYRDAMREHGLEAEIRVLPGGPTGEDGAAAVAPLLPDPPTAITVFNDLAATGVLDTLRRAGLSVPGDVSVVGYDDSRLARLTYLDLTTIAQDTEAMTTQAIQRAITRIEGAPVLQREVVTPPHLVVRGTTAPPPRNAALARLGPGGVTG